MQDDFLSELEFLGVTARLKRLSDTLSESIRELYRENDVDIEPSWHLILLYLQRHGHATVTQIARALRISQPAVTKVIHRMIARGYLDAVQDPADARKRNLRLTEEAVTRLPHLEGIWAAGQAAVREILGSKTTFLQSLSAFEAQVRRRGFKDRASDHLSRREQTAKPCPSREKEHM